MTVEWPGLPALPRTPTVDLRTIADYLALGASLVDGSGGRGVYSDGIAVHP